MQEKVKLKVMMCPTCGGSLKAEGDNREITCVYCGNLVVPVSDSNSGGRNESAAGGVVRVEGVQTPAAVLAYMEQFFEEYDWEVFTYAQSFTVEELDRLIQSVKITSADDKHTWLCCFQGTAVPFVHKVEGCRKILSAVIEEYRKDSLEAYSKFDAYNRIAASLQKHKTTVVTQLEKYAANAQRYGASAEECRDLNSRLEALKALALPGVYKCIESIPQIEAFIREKNDKIVAALAARGVDAQKEYETAKALTVQKQYAQALTKYLALGGYADSKLLADKLDKYYLISDVLEIDGSLYVFRKKSRDEGVYNLHGVSGKELEEKPIIKGIRKIITNYADILYYLDNANMLRKYHLSAKSGEKIWDTALDEKEIYQYGRRVFFVSTYYGEASQLTQDVVELNLMTGAVRPFMKGIQKILSLDGNKLVYQMRQNSGEDGVSVCVTNVVNIDTQKGHSFGTKDVTVKGFAGEKVVFTRDAPNLNNQDLYIKSLETNEPEKLIERNIYRFFAVIAGRLFYYIGNSKNQTLIHIGCDGTGRGEWPLYISKVLFVQGGWLYFVRKAGYNAIVCKSRLDGSGFRVIAADIEEFIEIKNGYLYYINDNAALVKVRMDGSNWEKLCDNVEKVLSVREEKILFVSVDDRVSSGFGDMVTVQTVKSIYAVDFTGSGKRKLAYHITEAKEYDENTVYYLAPQERVFEDGVSVVSNIEVHRLDVSTDRDEILLELSGEETSRGNGFVIAMVIMCVALFVVLMGFSAGEPAMIGIGLIGAVISLIAGVMIKAN